MKKAVAALLIGILCTAVMGVYANNTQKGIASSLVRLHILANSDSEADQSVKLKVRDRVIQEVGPLLDATSTIEDSYRIIDENMNRIVRIANEELLANGYEYGANAKLSKSYFPTRSYEGLSLPPGEYDSLIVSLGEGKGKNWWCVMFPPLCFVDSSKGELSDSAKAVLQENMTPEDYKLITESDTQLPVQMKFKVVELFENTKIKIRNAMK